MSEPAMTTAAHPLAAFKDQQGCPVRLDGTVDGGFSLTRITRGRDYWLNLTRGDMVRLRDMLTQYFEGENA